MTVDEIGNREFYFAPYAAEVDGKTPKQQYEFMHRYIKMQEGGNTELTIKILRAALLPNSSSSIIPGQIEDAHVDQIGRSNTFLVERSIPYGGQGRCTFGMIFCLQSLPEGVDKAQGWVQIEAATIPEFDLNIICASLNR